MKKSIRFIINPISGIGKKEILPDLIQKELNQSLFSYDIIYTEYRGHARELSKKFAEEKIDVVCIVGGDGSVNEVASSLVHTNTVLAILPMGSGNGIARHLGIPLKLKSAIHRLNEFQIIRMDTFKLNEKFSIGVSGFGFDALVAKKFDEYHKRGLFNYAKMVLKAWRGYKGVSVILNQKEYNNLLFCCIANTSQFGNNFYVSPQSDVKDEMIEVVIVKLINTLQLLILITSSILKKVHLSKFVEIIRVKKAELNIKNAIAHIDGDPVVFDNDTIHVLCIPKSLSVIV